ncbi:MAG: hypothetical protein ABFS35_03240 [Bacteroidota bacterium]
MSPKAIDVWIRFLYTWDTVSIEKMKEQLANIYMRYFPFKGSTVVHYLEGGYEKCLKPLKIET